MGGYEKATVAYMAPLYTSMDGVKRDMSCTGITGLTGFDGPSDCAKMLTVPVSGVGMQAWAAADFGGTRRRGYRGRPDPLAVTPCRRTSRCRDSNRRA
jgi:hypothetical protein